MKTGSIGNCMHAVTVQKFGFMEGAILSATIPTLLYADNKSCGLEIFKNTKAESA